MMMMMVMKVMRSNSGLVMGTMESRSLGYLMCYAVDNKLDAELSKCRNGIIS